ncbi:MAG TPA: transcriptional regulator [Bacteroidetes bacterium]|nr:transcriptional regulator [Bacteroidota bacterium]
MSLIFSKSCEYALQAILYLARQPQGEPALLREISDSLNIPHHFLNKVLQTLTRDEIVASFKGSNGGFALGRSPKEITLSDIVRAVDGESFLDHCVLGFPACGDKNPCPVHPQWKRAKVVIQDMIHRKTLFELSKELDPKLELLQQPK